ncbi:MAG TPA: DNA topoisomerase IB [Solirubrobacteraceae bacterium]
MPRLRRSDCAAPGIARRRRGRGFEYRDPAGDRIDDPEALERISQLAIPPAWREAWICMDSLGHLQATGIDAAGRKQYLYHPCWRSHRDRLKFDSMIAFGESLPRLRRRLGRDLAAEPATRATPTAKSGSAAELPRERTLACAVRLLDLGFFRIGSEDYAERNESYGLTTMLKRHVSIAASEVIFDYVAKSGVRRVQAIADPGVLEVVAALKHRRGSGQLLAYREGRRWVEVHAEDVNAYIKLLSGGDFTAKDFRTWNATVLAAVALAGADMGTEAEGQDRNRDKAKAKRPTATSRRRVVNAAVKTVAAYLGNTPAVCRASYIDPRVIDRYQASVTIAPALERLPNGPELANPRTRARTEAAVLELLADAPAVKPD